MARITEASLDDRERQRLPRRAALTAPRRPTVNVAPASPLVSLAFIVGGTGAILAPDLLPWWARLSAIGAVAVGGWLARGRGDSPPEERAALARREAELNRVLIAFAVRGLTEPARPPERDDPPAAAPQQPADGGDDREAGRAVLHAVGDEPGDESLDPDADEPGGPG